MRNALELHLEFLEFSDLSPSSPGLGLRCPSCYTADPVECVSPSRKALFQNGVVVSDLHLFARRSQAGACLEQIRPLLRRSDLLVLNGDTFDFRWSTIGDIKSTESAALDWLQDLLREYSFKVHLLLGNHDCVAEFPRRLDELQTQAPRFHWHEYALRLGPALFLHGECSLRRMNHAALLRYREPWRHDAQRGRLAAAAYRYADHLGLTRMVHAAQFPRFATVQRVAHYLDRTYAGWTKGTLDCYFGHTHRPFSGYEYRGVRFHNTGSAIRGMHFNPLPFRIQDPPES